MVQHIRCADCKAKNRLPAVQAIHHAKCGRCGQALWRHPSATALAMRCGQCQAKNRIPAARVGHTAKCGRCGNTVNTDLLAVNMPLDILDGDFEQRVLQAPLPALLFCWAPWCPSCQTMLPVMDELALKGQGRALICKLNMDDNPLVANRYNIRSAPTIMIFERGEILDTIVGAVPKYQLMQKMAHYT